LGASRSLRYCAIGLIFILGLIVVDQIVLLLGDYVSESDYYSDNLIRKIELNSSADAFVVGTCRAALHFDSEILTRSTGVSFFNAGRVVDNIGNIDLTLDVILAKKAPKFIFIVIDDGLLEAKKADGLDDLNRRRLSWSHLDKTDRDELGMRYGFNSLFLNSGLWKYRGLGEELFRTFFRKVMNRNSSNSLDGYEPRDAGINIENSIRDPLQNAEYQRAIRTELNTSPFAVNTLGEMVKKIQRKGVTPIFVISPMNRLRANDSAVEAQVRETLLLGERFGVLVINYLDNAGEIGSIDKYWTDPGHMNRLGAEELSRRLSADLERLNVLGGEGKKK
jgi:hypothetical protein